MNAADVIASMLPSDLHPLWGKYIVTALDEAGLLRSVGEVAVLQAAQYRETIRRVALGLSDPELRALVVARIEELEAEVAHLMAIATDTSLEREIQRAIDAVPTEFFVDSEPWERAVARLADDWRARAIVEVPQSSVTCLHQGALAFGGTCFSKRADRAHIDCALAHVRGAAARSVGEVAVLQAARHAASYYEVSNELAGGPWTNDRLADWNAAHDLFKAAMRDLVRAVAGLVEAETPPAQCEAEWGTYNPRTQQFSSMCVQDAGHEGTHFDHNGDEMPEGWTDADAEAAMNRSVEAETPGRGGIVRAEDMPLVGDPHRPPEATRPAPEPPEETP